MRGKVRNRSPQSWIWSRVAHEIGFDTVDTAVGSIPSGFTESWCVVWPYSWISPRRFLRKQEALVGGRRPLCALLKPSVGHGVNTAVSGSCRLRTRCRYQRLQRANRDEISLLARLAAHLLMNVVAQLSFLGGGGDRIFELNSQIFLKSFNRFPLK